MKTKKTYHLWTFGTALFLCFVFSYALVAQPKSIDPVWQLAYVEIGGSTNVNEFFLNYSEPITCSFDNNATNQRSHATTNRFKIPVSEIKGDSPLLLKDFRQMLNAGSHPYIYIDMNESQFTEIERNRNNQNFSFDVTINGVRKKCKGIGSTFYDSDNGVYTLNGSTNLLLSNFNLQAPRKFLGLIKVSDEVNIRFRLIFTSELNTKLGAL